MNIMMQTLDTFVNIEDPMDNKRCKGPVSWSLYFSGKWEDFIPFIVVFITSS